jgi:hypothetical protein
MAEYDDKLSVALPEALRQQFAQVERRLWRVESTVAVCCVAGGLMVSFLVLFVSDRVWDTPGWLRLTLLLCGLAVAALAAVRWARRWVWQRRDLRSLANLVQKKYRRLGDRLLGIVELANEERHNANFSPALYHAAINQVADEARGYDFGQSVSTRTSRKMALLAAGLAACLALLFGVLPQPGWNALVRWALPAAKVPRFTLVTLDGLPAELIVPHGEPFSIAATVHYRSFWKPHRAWALWPRQPDIESNVQDGQVRLQVPGKVENGVLEVRVGDASAGVKIQPTYRPSLQELTAHIQLPGYLHYPDQDQILQNASMLAVEGSKVAFQGKVSRSLATALMQSGGEYPAELRIQGDSFTTAQTQPDGQAQYTFNWRDNLGLTNAVPLRLSVEMQPDAPPVPEIVDMPGEIAVLNSDVLNIHLRALDDFGVHDLGLTWNMTADSPPSAVATTEVKTQPSSAHVKEAEKVFLWSPSMFRIPADSTVELQGFARDYFPDRERSRTTVYRIRVLSPEEHAELVRQQLETVLAQVEEVTRLQEKIVAGLGEVKDAEKMAPTEKAARLGQTKDNQTQNAANLDELSDKGERAVREAMKNPLLNEETIRQWTQSMQQMRQLSQQKMPAAANTMQSAQQNSGTKPQEMADAMQQAEDILKELAKMQSKANQHLDNLQALTLAQRLRKVGGEEKDIGGQLFDSASNTIGLLPSDLPEKLKSFENGLVRDQSAAQKQTTTLQSELSRFFERTQKPEYGAVNKEMKDTHTGDELDRLGGLIENNIGLEASDNLGQWSARFQKWADKLEPKNSGSGSGSGSGSQKKNDLTEQLIALLRLRENEVNLHDQTTLLDQNKGAADSYQQRAATLAGSQEKMAGDLNGIHEKTAVPQLDSAFADTAGTMKDVLTLLRQPQTGQPADGAEVKTIDSLSDLINLINEQAQHSQSQSSLSQSASADEEMQFLMQMSRNPANAKAFAVQPNRGSSSPGGTTSRANGRSLGNAAGKDADGRSVNQAAGIIEHAPVEFRDALENYYHGLEHSKE